jgi:predicted nuclease of predicted toxin-antitoxin system
MPLTPWRMKPCMRFLVDENLPKDVAEALERAGADVVYVAGSDLAGRPDDYLNSLASWRPV